MHSRFTYLFGRIELSLEEQELNLEAAPWFGSSTSTAWNLSTVSPILETHPVPLRYQIVGLVATGTSVGALFVAGEMFAKLAPTVALAIPSIALILVAVWIYLATNFRMWTIVSRDQRPLFEALGSRELTGKIGQFLKRALARVETPLSTRTDAPADASAATGLDQAAPGTAPPIGRAVPYFEFIPPENGVIPAGWFHLSFQCHSLDNHHQRQVVEMRQQKDPATARLAGLMILGPAMVIVMGSFLLWWTTGATLDGNTVCVFGAAFVVGVWMLIIGGRQTTSRRLAMERSDPAHTALSQAEIWLSPSALVSRNLQSMSAFSIQSAIWLHKSDRGILVGFPQGSIFVPQRAFESLNQEHQFLGALMTYGTGLIDTSMADF